MSKTENHVTAPRGAFAGPTDFARVVREALACAAREGWSSMVWSDPNFADWPLGERAVIDTLNAWAGGGRSLVILAHHFDGMVRLKPRFVTWRQTWDHIIECRICRNLDATEVPSAFWSPNWAM